MLLDTLSPAAGGDEAAAAAAAAAAAEAEAAEAATAEEADAAVAAAMLPAFLPALQEFDALLELEPRRLPRRAMQLGTLTLTLSLTLALTLTAARCSSVQAAARPDP